MIEFFIALIGWTLFVIVAIPYFIVAMWATARVARKAGLSGWWGLVALAPPVWIVGLWLFAFLDWPRDRIAPPRRW
ncbi:MAG: hypothetical protein EAZ99_07530 [Alphaproteobacteria bacterium]|nr:hypothetical protein [Alphaproteobacteria bacterium]TAD90069.1 MAG: hypothetical protein EAZ99_07530 [Alphaproteobacteria bacterium]